MLRCRYAFYDEAHHYEKDGSNMRANMARAVDAAQIVELSATFTTGQLEYSYPMDRAIEEGYISGELRVRSCHT